MSLTRPLVLNINYEPISALATEDHSLDPIIKVPKLRSRKNYFTLDVVDFTMP